jgi:hypothetical protein
MTNEIKRDLIFAGLGLVFVAHGLWFADGFDEIAGLFALFVASI